MLDYHMSVSRVVTQKDIEESRKCTLCGDAVKRTLATMLDIKLLKTPSFLLLSLNAIFTSMGFYTPYMFITDRALQMNIPENVAFWLLSCIGIANTLGRIVCGIMSSFPSMPALRVSYVGLMISGSVTALSGICGEIWVQFFCAALYGLTVASMSTLRTIIIVEILGLDKLTNAVGLILMFQGVASMVGTALAGYLRDLTGNYELSFYFAGGSIFIGSVFLIPIQKISVWEKRKRQNI